MKNILIAALLLLSIGAMAQCGDMTAQRTYLTGSSISALEHTKELPDGLTYHKFSFCDGKMLVTIKFSGEVHQWSYSLYKIDSRFEVMNCLRLEITRYGCKEFPDMFFEIGADQYGQIHTILQWNTVAKAANLYFSNKNA